MAHLKLTLFAADHSQAVMPKKAAVRKAKPTGKPKAVKPTARPALKSALKSSSSEEKTVKKVRILTTLPSLTSKFWSNG